MIVHRLRLLSVVRFFLLHLTALSAWSGLAVAGHLIGHHPEVFGHEGTWLPRIAEALRLTAVGLPVGALAALGGALAIFLGFRNNSAYDRWWEARKIWGALVNDSRSWTRQVLAWVEAPSDATDPAEAVEDLRRELVHRHLAFVHGLALHLRKRPELVRTVGQFVPEAEAKRYASVPNIPTALLFEQGRRVAEARAAGQIEHFRHLAMDHILTRLSDIQGKCERIKNTPLPPQFNQFPRWFVYVYCAMLPSSFAEAMGWVAVPVSVIIGILFIALEGSGRIIEDPFENLRSDTPMTALAVTIERDLRSALGEPLPEPVQPDEQGALL